MTATNCTLSACSTGSRLSEGRGSGRCSVDRDTRRTGAANTTRRRRSRCRSLPAAHSDSYQGNHSREYHPAQYASRTSSDGSSRMRVGVRVRPPFRHEVVTKTRSGGYRSAVTVVKSSDEIRQRCVKPNGLQQSTGSAYSAGEVRRETEVSMVKLTTPDGRQRSFPYDHVFGPGCGQEEIYESLAAPVVKGCLAGLHGLVLAYGQTASGKSYTMGIGEDPGDVSVEETSLAHPFRMARRLSVGAYPQSNVGREFRMSDYTTMYSTTSAGDVLGHTLSACHNADSGVIPRTLSHLFQHVGSVSGDLHISLKISLLQIYNEVVQDLLTPAARNGADSVGLNVREDPSLGFFVEGLREYAVNCQEDAAALISLGLRQRATARTTRNDISSRSHTILTIALEQQRKDTVSRSGDEATIAGCTIDQRLSKLLLVDLAGSERAGRPRGCEGDYGTERLKEAGYINGSLSALGNVVAALGRAELDRPHIPFRDSKLTRILADSLGGDANAALVTTVGPAPQNHMESLSTLMFASRCMRLRSSPIRHKAHDQTETTLRLQAQLSSMQREFCRREALQQSRYEVVITRLAQELGDVRKAESTARNTGEPLESESHVRVSAQSTADDTGTTYTDLRIHPKGHLPECKSEDDNLSVSGSAGGHTDVSKSSDEGVVRNVRQGPSAHPNHLSGRLRSTQRQRSILTRPAAAAPADAQGERALLSSPNFEAWELVDLAVATLEAVTSMGAGVVGTCNEAQVAKSSTTIPNDIIGAPIETVGDGSISTIAGAKERVLRRLDQCRRHCKGQWEEAEAIITRASRETTSLEENLSEERVERQRQEKQAQRLRGALQHMLSDGNSLNRFGSTPNAPSKEPRSPSPDTSLQRHAWGVDEASDTAVESGQTAVLGLVRAYEIDTRTPTD